jgi:hypothetical protein
MVVTMLGMQEARSRAPNRAAALGWMMAAFAPGQFAGALALAPCQPAARASASPCRAALALLLTIPARWRASPNRKATP